MSNPFQAIEGSHVPWLIVKGFDLLTELAPTVGDCPTSKGKSRIFKQSRVV